MKDKELVNLIIRISLLWLLILLVGSYVWWQLSHTQLQTKQRSQQDAQLRATQLAEAKAATLQTLLATFDQGMQQFHQLWLQNPDEATNYAHLIAVSLPQGLMRSLVVLDAVGNILFTSGEDFEPPAMNTVSSVEPGSLSRSQLVVSSPMLTSDGWLIAVSRSFQQDGHADVRVALYLNSSAIADILLPATLSSKDVVALLKDDGVFLARTAEHASAMGQSVLLSRPFLQANPAQMGAFFEPGSLDQIPRLFAWWRLADYGLIMVVGLDQANVDVPLLLKRKQDLVTVAQLGAVLILIGVLLSVLYWREGKQQRSKLQTQQMLMAINQAQSRFIDGDSAHVVFNEVLQALLQQSGSEYGFIGEVMQASDDRLYIKAYSLSDIAWNEETRQLYTAHLQDGLDFHNLDTLFGRVVTEQALIIANDVVADPRRRGLPEGHPPLHRFMGIPVYHNGNISGVIALANSIQPYHASLVALLKPLITACDNLFGSMQRDRQRLTAERKVVELNKTLEQRVEKRTRELERASSAKNEFLSRMSHELRTPLNAILGFTQLLQLKEAQPFNAQQAEHVQEISAAGEHLLTLVNEILDLARIESGQLALNTEPLALEPLLEHCVAQIAPLAQGRSIEPELIIRQPCTVMADPTRLKQVLLNLLSNAVKYNAEGGSLQLESMPVINQQVRINVRDTGQGLSDEQQARLFQPFERLESAYNGIEGTGIGLALVKQLVEGMQGRIGVSSSPGQGSCFWFELPVCEAAALVAPQNETAVRVTTSTLVTESTHIILYIEDNPANLRLVQKILARHSEFTLLTADSGKQGIALALQERPALILLDINMPGMDGFAVLQELQANPLTRHVPAIAISANAMQRDIERAKAAGFIDYITKPIQVPAFLQSIKHCLHSKLQPLDGEDTQ